MDDQSYGSLPMEHREFPPFLDEYPIRIGGRTVSFYARSEVAKLIIDRLRLASLYEEKLADAEAGDAARAD